MQAGRMLSASTQHRERYSQPVLIDIGTLHNRSAYIPLYTSLKHYTIPKAVNRRLFGAIRLCDVGRILVVLDICELWSQKTFMSRPLTSKRHRARRILRKTIELHVSLLQVHFRPAVIFAMLIQHLRPVLQRLLLLILVIRPSGASCQYSYPLSR